METARDKARSFVIQMQENCLSPLDLAISLEKLLKEYEILIRKDQHKITKNACADLIEKIAHEDGYDKDGVLIQTSQACMACMNVKAV